MKHCIIIEVESERVTGEALHLLTRRIAVQLAPQVRAIVTAQPEPCTVTTSVPRYCPPNVEAGVPDALGGYKNTLPGLPQTSPPTIDINPS